MRLGAPAAQLLRPSATDARRFCLHRSPSRYVSTARPAFCWSCNSGFACHSATYPAGLRRTMLLGKRMQIAGLPEDSNLPNPVPWVYAGIHTSQGATHGPLHWLAPIVLVLSISWASLGVVIPAARPRSWALRPKWETAHPAARSPNRRTRTMLGRLGSRLPP